MDLPERYKLRAQLYLERAKQAANPGAKKRLLKMAEYWLLRAELAYEETHRDEAPGEHRSNGKDNKNKLN